MLTITIQDTNTERYTYTASANVLGRRYDNIAEYVSVVKPESEAGRDCIMIVTYGDTVVDHIPVGDTPIAIMSNLSQYASVKIGFAFLGTDGYIKNSEVKQFYFLTAQKPDGFVPLPPEQKTTIDYLIANGFTNVTYKDNVLSFTNAAGGAVAEINLNNEPKNLLNEPIHIEANTHTSGEEYSATGWVYLDYNIPIDVTKNYIATIQYNGETYQSKASTYGGSSAAGESYMFKFDSPPFNVNNYLAITNGQPSPDSVCEARFSTSNTYDPVPFWELDLLSIVESTEVVANKLKHALTIVVNGQEYVFDGSSDMRIEINTEA